MKRKVVQSWLGGLLVTAALVLGVAAPAVAQDKKDDLAMAKEAQQIDASARRADATRVDRRIAEEFSDVKVKSSATDPGRPLTIQDVRNLRSNGLGYGEIAILLSLYAHQSGTSFRSMDQILASRQSGQGWGQIAKGMGYDSLGAVRRDMKRTDHAVDVVARPMKEGERRQAERMQAEAKQLEAEATTASSTPEGQRRVTEAIAKELKVQESVVTNLRSKGLGFGEVTIAVALAEDLQKRDKSLTTQQALDRVLARRDASQGWGEIAHDLDLKLGHVTSEVKKAQKEIAHVGGAREGARMEKAERRDREGKLEKPERPEKFEKPEKPEKPEKMHMEKPERAERPGR